MARTARTRSSDRWAQVPVVALSTDALSPPAAEVCPHCGLPTVPSKPTAPSKFTVASKPTVASRAPGLHCVECELDLQPCSRPEEAAYFLQVHNAMHHRGALRRHG